MDTTRLLATAALIAWLGFGLTACGRDAKPSPGSNTTGANAGTGSPGTSTTGGTGMATTGSTDSSMGAASSSNMGANGASSPMLSASAAR